jgi:hypothetical protein
MDVEGIAILFMSNRWYEPKTGRFLSEDPIGLAGGINLYSFASNDPISESDPTGLRPPMGKEAVDSPSPPSNRDIGNPFGGSTTLDWLGGGGSMGLSAGSSIYSNTRCGGRIDLNGATAPGDAVMGRLCGYARTGSIAIQFTNGWAGTRSAAQCAQKPDRCDNLHATNVGMAADFTVPGSRPQVAALALVLYLLQNEPAANYQVHWYSPVGKWTGFVHFGAGGNQAWNLAGWQRTEGMDDVAVGFLSWIP